MIKRNYSLDYMKAFLVFFMIFAHCIQLTHNKDLSPAIINKVFGITSLFVNLITFSTFFFVFGYVFYIAYLSKLEISKKKLLNNGINILTTYYLSAISIKIFNTNNFTSRDLKNILLLNDIIEYSEFILSFAFICFFSIIFGKQILFLTSNFKILIISCLSFLGLTYIIPYDIIPNQLGIIIGTSKFASFPILLYLPYFLFGIYISRNKLIFDKKTIISAIISQIIFLAYFLISKKIPERFPPSAVWIMGSFFYTYLLYLLSNWISNKFNYFQNTILKLGSNTLFFLLFSNIIIFYVRNEFVQGFDWVHTILLFISIIFAGNFIIKIIRN